MSDDLSKTPEWVRFPDGSQAPFDADHIARTLFAATESLGEANALLARELTDAVLHFLAREDEPAPSTTYLIEHVAKVVRELGHPALAQRYAQMQAAGPAVVAPPHVIAIEAADSPADVVRRTLEAYSLHVLFSPDLASAMQQGLLHVTSLAQPDTLTRYLIDARTLGADSWWLHWDAWKACGDAWIVDSPEWLSILPADRSPMIRLCERIIALPRAARHPVELHLNVAEPPGWMRSQSIGPLFADADDPASHSLRYGLQDMIVEQCLATRDAAVPALAWHLNESCWRDAVQRGRLKSLVRHAVHGKGVRFVFDRPRMPITLTEGMDRKNSGVLLEIGLDLAAFAERPDIAHDGAALLAKAPCLARMAVSAAKQKQAYLRTLPEDSPLARGFLIERSACVVTPLGLDTVVRAVTGQSMTKSPLSLDFARRIVHTIKDALRQASRSISVDMRLDGQLEAAEGTWASADATVSLRKQLETAGCLHAEAGGGAMTLVLADETDANADALVNLLRWAWESTGVQRLQLQRAGSRLHQGELMVD